MYHSFELRMRKHRLPAVNEYSSIYIHQDVEPAMVQCCGGVVDGGPTFSKHGFNVSCFGAIAKVQRIAFQTEGEVGLMFAHL